MDSKSSESSSSQSSSSATQISSSSSQSHAQTQNVDAQVSELLKLAAECIRLKRFGRFSLFRLLIDFSLVFWQEARIIYKLKSERHQLYSEQGAYVGNVNKVELKGESIADVSGKMRRTKTVNP